MHTAEPAASVPQFPTDRAKLIAFLNELNPPGPLQLRPDAHEGQIAEARAAAFEELVDRETYRIASDGDRNPVRQEQLTALRSLVRARMLAATNPNADGLLGKLGKKLARMAQLESEREALAREEAELVAASQKFEALLEQRRELAKKVKKAEARLESLPPRRTALIDGVRMLYLSDWDNAHGSDVLGGILESYSAIAAIDLALADAPKLRKEWAAQLAEMDRQIAAFSKAHGI